MVSELKDIPRRHYTMEEYFALERVGEARYEYWNGDILCMSGGSLQHARIGGNIFLSLGAQLKGKGCQPFNGEISIKTPQLPPYRYPDVSVVCDDPIIEKIEGFDVLVNPIVVIEVLSPGTASLDRNQKRAAYQAIPSVQEVLLISQEAPFVTRYLRQNEAWTREDVGGLGGLIELPSIACRMALNEIYEGVPFL